MGKSLTTLCADADQFLMLYGVDFPQNQKRVVQVPPLRAALGTPSEAAIEAVRRFLFQFYHGSAGTDLTGADGLDMDEAFAAQLYRDIVAYQNRRP